MDEFVRSKLENIALTEEEEEDVLLDGEIDEPAMQLPWSLVGKILTLKKKIWSWDKLLKILDVGPNLFRFRFSSEFYMSKAEDGGPWNFDDNLFLIKPWERGMTVTNTTFGWLDLRIQILGIAVWMS
ncbi:hypothetical protein RJ639_001424 [Escallonia herrerae]|uniref:DUF4283 domain-containing protein n=1 Tax=Escallonia herrerae TaxID=1293975 RepID=A0AA88X7G2_9ASTE|nr:hypothetical protein RJ639_001424 [Escallonia herrerae]